jgi:hypothetical protein
MLSLSDSMLVPGVLQQGWIGLYRHACEVCQVAVRTWLCWLHVVVALPPLSRDACIRSSTICSSD